MSNGWTYRAHGVEFWVPEQWSVHEERTPDHLSISIESPGTGFWSVTLLFDRPAPEKVAEAVVDAYTLEYDEHNMDVYNTDTEVCGCPVIGREVDFFCFDLLNTAVIHVFQTDQLTVLLLFQGTDKEMKKFKNTFRRISESLRLDASLGTIPQK